MEFVMNCDMDNAAFEYRSATELARILREQVIPGLKRGDDGGKLRDINGNTVGSWEVR